MDNLLNNLGNGLHFMHLNVRSILAKYKFDMLKTQIASSNLGVLTISESWLRIDNCGFGPFCSTPTKILFFILLLEVLICIIY